MARTVIGGSLIKDGDVGREDINVSTNGRAVITKVVAGTSISMSSTGADAGTGDVTINLDSSNLVTSFNGRVGGINLTYSDVISGLGFNPISGTEIGVAGADGIELFNLNYNDVISFEGVGNIDIEIDSVSKKVKIGPILSPENTPFTGNIFIPVDPPIEIVVESGLIVGVQ